MLSRESNEHGYLGSISLRVDSGWLDAVLTGN